MPIWLTIGVDIIKALFAGDFKRWWTEHKVEKADEDQNKVISMSDSELTKRVRDEITRS